VEMKKLLIQLDTDSRPSTFDQVVAYDAGTDNIISHAGIKKKEVEDIIYGAVFTRSPKKMNNTAVFIGGSDVNKGEEILAEVKEVFFANFRVSVLLDSNGANTTAAAAVLKIKNVLDLKGKKAAVIAGTGPVGVRAAMLFAKEGAEVVITSRSQKRAEKKAEEIMERYGVKNIYGVQASKKEEFEKIISGKDVILSAGPPKINFITEDMWKKADNIKAMGDINAVSPVGIKGIKPGADGDIIDGVKIFGALGIGGLKMKLHKKAISELFNSSDIVFDVLEVYKLYSEL